MDGARKTSPFDWSVGVPLVQMPKDDDEYEEAAAVDAAVADQPRFGVRRRPAVLPPSKAA